MWYRAHNRSFYCWDDLVQQLTYVFRPANYSINLWEEIQTRTQGPDGKVVLYLFAMQNLFRRLPNEVKEKEKLQ